jgi:4-hydroxybenzoate polyprenyltransferase
MSSRLGVGARGAWWLFLSARPISLAVLAYICLRAVALGGGLLAPRVSLAVVLLAMCAAAAFLFNDAFDADADARGGRLRPVAQGRCEGASAAAAALVLVGAASVVATSVGGPLLMLEVGGIGACGIAYSPIAQRYGFTKGAIACGLCLCPVAIATRLAGAHVSVGWYVAAAMFLFGRELLMDLRDWTVDREAGRRTMPHMVGAGAAAWIGWACVVGGVLLIVGPSHMNRTWTLLLYLTLLASGVAWKANRELSTGMLRVTMLMAVERIAAG